MQRNPASFQIILITLLVMLTGIPANAQVAFPKLTGRVVDAAHMINAETTAALTRELAAFEEKSSDQVVVATIISLNGQPLEQYANVMFRRWELGQAQENNGVLLLISKNDRKIRIEVGYGLEGVLTDALAKLIIDNVIVPDFKKRRFSDGIAAGTRQILKVLEGDVAELEARAKRNKSFKNGLKSFNWALLPFIIIGLFMGWTLVMMVLVPVFGKKIGPGHYRWRGTEIRFGSGGGSSGSGGWSGGSSGGGFSGGGGSSGSW